MDYSVVIPTYNRRESTVRAVKSALAQTLPPREVLVVDDGSSPAFHLPSDLAAEPARVIRLPQNRGAAAARQAGVEAARQPVLAFLDSDDVWRPDKLAAQAATIARARGALVAVACGWRDAMHDRDRVPVAAATPDAFASGCWFCPGSTLVIERATFARIGPFDASLRRLEDWEWFLRFGRCGGRIEVAPIIGADIHPSRSASAEQIRFAEAYILARHASAPAAQRRLMRSYAALEQAAAARHSGETLKAYWHLVVSLALKPRPHLPLRRWWTDKVVHDAS